MSEETIIIAGDSEPVRYKDIPGCPGYRVGSDGSVWSLHAPFGHARKASWHQLKQTAKDNGYTVVGLRPQSEQRYRGKVRVVYVHRLVLEAFAGPCPDGMEALHNDGNPSNNRLDNLRWGTRLENSADALKHGTRILGSRAGNALLHEEDIPLIRQLDKRGFPNARIAALFGVAETTIASVLQGRTWKHV